NARRAANAVRLAAGLDRPRTGCTPHVVVWRQDRVTLRRYRAGMDAGGPPLLLVPSLINRSHIWDLRPGDSFAGGLLAHGSEGFLFAWVPPTHRNAANSTSTDFDETGNVPPGTLLRAFQMLRPLGDLAGYITLWDRLDDRKAAQAIWALTDWAHDHVPFPGVAFVEMIRELSRENGMFTGEVLLD